MAKEKNTKRKLRRTPVSPAKHVARLFETLGTCLCYGFFRILPYTWASGLGGRLGRTIGPKLGVSRRALANIAIAFPDMPEEERERVLRGMWDNLGRVLAEYPHLRRMKPEIMELVGGEHVERARAQGKGVVFFTGHVGNWEMIPAGAVWMGVDDLNIVYREPNNPWIEGLLRHARSSGATGHIPKSKTSAREIVGVIRRGESLGILTDQRLKEGIEAPFFGRPAMTPPVVAQLALKFGAPLLPARVERIDKTRFRLTVSPPLKVENTGDGKADTLRVMTEVNGILEDWIRDRPEQWLWLHRRWSDG